jgi:hypothetical protein
VRNLRRTLAEERGATAIAVVTAIVMIFAFAVIAIDMSLIQLAKTQLQNAADAAAIAGAIAMADAVGSQAAGVAGAITYAGLNTAVQDVDRPVIITSADVTFPEANRIRVETHRTQADGDPVQLYFLKVLNPVLNNLGDVKAVASASVFPVSSTDCLKPWCFPDKWDDTDNDSLYDVGEFYDPEITGYKVPDHIGVQIVLKLNSSQSSPRMGWFYAVDFAPINTGEPVITGADAYREYIWSCEPFMISIGDQLQVEPGNMIGPTAQGVADLIAVDPNAYWEASSGTVQGSDFPSSPRIIKVATFDPSVGIQTDSNGRDYLTVVKIVVVFVEDVQGKEVIGRFMRKLADGEICAECSQGFIYRAVLVE